MMMTFIDGPFWPKFMSAFRERLAIEPTTAGREIGPIAGALASLASV
jgi:hypothetical protein